MIICKYTRIDSSVYIPHLDILRALSMAIRRTGLSINFSDGFNPHARLFFGQPLPLGTASVCEYFTADSNENAQTFMEKINNSMPKGFTILKCANIDYNPNVANMMTSADYTVSLFEELPPHTDLSSVMSDKELVITYKAKDEIVSKDVKSLVYSIKNSSDKLFFTLACGNTNLRADRLATHLLKGLNAQNFKSVLRTGVYDKNGENLDKILFKDFPLLSF